MNIILTFLGMIVICIIWNMSDMPTDDFNHRE